MIGKNIALEYMTILHPTSHNQPASSWPQQEAVLSTTKEEYLSQTSHINNNLARTDISRSLCLGNIDWADRVPRLSSTTNTPSSTARLRKNNQGFMLGTLRVTTVKTVMIPLFVKCE